MNPTGLRTALSCKKPENKSLNEQVIARPVNHLKVRLRRRFVRFVNQPCAKTCNRSADHVSEKLFRLAVVFVFDEADFLVFISRMPTDLLQLVDSVRAGNPANSPHLGPPQALLSHICRRHLGHGMDFDDLMQEAQLGFLYGVRVKYIHSPEHNMTHLTSYCSRWARRNVRRAIQNMGSLIPRPGVAPGPVASPRCGGRQTEQDAGGGPADLGRGSGVTRRRSADRAQPPALRSLAWRSAAAHGHCSRSSIVWARAPGCIDQSRAAGPTFEEIGQELRRRGLRAEVPTFSQVRHLYRAAVVKVQKWMRRNRIGVEDVLG